jgi:hypothetical protein
LNAALSRDLPAVVAASLAVAALLWAVAGDGTTRGLAELLLASLLVAGLALLSTPQPRGSDR